MLWHKARILHKSEVTETSEQSGLEPETIRSRIFGPSASWQKENRGRVRTADQLILNRSLNFQLRHEGLDKRYPSNRIWTSNLRITAVQYAHAYRTVGRGAEERFAKERPGRNFIQK